MGKKNVLQFDIGFIYAKGLHIISVSQIQPGTYFVNKILLKHSRTCSLYIITAFAYYNGRVAKLQQNLWSEKLKVLLSGPWQKKRADPWCRQRCRRHVLSVQTHMQNLIFWQRDITKTNKGQSSKLLKQLRIVAWVSSGRNSGIHFFFEKRQYISRTYFA